ncbi:MAG: hypothetical protein B7C24_12740 [Bacteroidetes bacterium 4572_77]|nr:MAG: hypothetical protein B7C24_12740 [Bacteroidetes bacterium 4572_77]
MKYWKTLFLIVAMSMFIMSCGDDPVEPNNNDDDDDDSTNYVETKFFPANVDSYWIFENHTVTPEEELAEVASYDSVFVTNEVNNDHNSKYDIYTDYAYMQNGEANRKLTLYEYRDTDELFADITYLFAADNAFLNLIKEALGDSLSGFGMVEIADFAATEKWNLLPEVTTDSLVLASFTVTDIVYNIEGKREAQETVTIGTETFENCEVMTITHKLAGVAQSVISLPITLDLVTKSYYAKNIGLVKYSIEPVDAMGLYKVNGTANYNIRHHISE